MNMSRLRIISIVLGLVNIYMGFVYARIIFKLQGFYLILFSLLFIIFGIGLLLKLYFKKLLLFGISPLIILFSLNIMMLGIDKDVPSYYQTPLMVGLSIILPFWLVIIADFFVVGGNGKKD